MKYVIISPTGLSFFLVPRLNRIAEVEQIFFCVPDMKELGKDMEQLPDYSKLVMEPEYASALNQCDKKSTIVIIDDVGIPQTGAMLRSLGWQVIGGGVLADKLEEDRTFATNLMKKVMQVPETFTFDTFEAGIAFLKSQDKKERLVFKPNDADAPKEYTYVAKDIADLIEHMKEFKEEWKWKTTFQLQRVVKGTEVDFNGYFNGKDFLNLTIYFENKPIMNDDIGPSGGGSIAVQISRPFQGVFADILEKVKPIFIKDGYKGCIAINSIVSEEDHKPYFLEFTNRFGYPSLPLDVTELEDNGKTVHDLFKALVSEKKVELFPLNKPTVVVSVGVPPYPTKEAEEVKGIKITWSKDWDIYFFPSYIMYDKKKGVVLSGNSNEPLQVTCMDETLDGAVSMLYETYMPTLRLKGAMYRTDCGKDAKKRLAKIKDYELF